MTSVRPGCATIALICSVAWGSQAVPANNSTELPTYIDRNAASAITSWLVRNPDYHVLDDSDCKCNDDLMETRTQTHGVWVGNPEYHPYYVLGDFNGDGRLDVAIGVGKRGLSGKFSVLIIDNYEAQHAPIGGGFLSRPFDIGEALFFGPPRPKPYSLLVGHFDSEGWEFIPKRGGQYILR